MDSQTIRQSFLDFFEARGHAIVESAPLVPDNDPTLLFTNSGMVQFKEALAFRENRGYTRAASCQRCVRAGGKHNDLDNVGYTARHHTFFEMLGNFSFGDYFKEDAIRFSWEYLTQVVGLPPEKLWITVHDSDDEAEKLWIEEIGVNPERISRLGDESNFWTMGDTGPCGPCSEIFYDHGPEVPGGPPGSPDDELDRYIEIWNLVFTQYDRAADGTLTPLPKPCVDTGMGLERLAAVVQNVHDNYDIDLFQALIHRAANLLKVTDLTSPSLKVIADHARCACFLIADGVVPSNEGRGYVLRRIIRRALRHGHKLQPSELFFHKMVSVVVSEMGQAYPLLVQTQEQLERVLLKEEEQFELTLDQGLRILADAIDNLDGEVVPGEVVFKLYDTYGFPADLTADIAREKSLVLDMEGFERQMDAQRDRARASSQFSTTDVDLDLPFETEFVGYDAMQAKSKVLALLSAGGTDKKDDRNLDKAVVGDEVLLVLDRSPFYAESGGQVGDTGEMTGKGMKLAVTDTVKSGNAFVHQVRVLEGEVGTGSKVECRVNSELREATRLNHSATHLMHAALREVLGEHVTQRGSLVNADRLRFDFSHFEPVTPAQLRAIERMVNEQVRRNSPVETEIMPLDAARKKGALALFGEKYSEKVRVLTMGEGFSVELCGGTHVSRTGDIGLFKITSEQGTGSGVRRIEAVTGEAALALVESQEDTLSGSASLLKADPQADFLGKLESLLEKNKQLEKTVADLNRKLASGTGQDLTDAAIDLGDFKLLVTSLDGADPKSLPDALDQLKNKLGSGLIVLGTVKDGKVGLIAGVTKDLTSRFNAGELVNHVAEQVGGKGGGRADMARAGGSDPAALPDALASVEAWVRKLL